MLFMLFSLLLARMCGRDSNRSTKFLFTSGNIFCNPCLIASSTLVYVSGVWAVFVLVPFFATTKARISRSDIWPTGPLGASKVVILGNIVRWKSEAEVSLTRGCEAVMFTVDAKLLAWWFLTGNAKDKFVRCYLIFFPSSNSLVIGSGSYSGLINSVSNKNFFSFFQRFSFAAKSSQRSLVLLVSSLFNAD